MINAPLFASELYLNDFSYHLPESRIAKFPLKIRDASKLLHWDGKIQDLYFSDLPNLLPKYTELYFNNTKVVHARLIFKRETGANIEVFCLEPIAPHTDIQLALQQTDFITWNCLIGNGKRWKYTEKLSIEINGVCLFAKRDETNVNHVHFTWNDNSLCFADILTTLGKLPLPPYLNRDATDIDSDRYQTIYAQEAGAVAAPTAGLHFTEKIFKGLDKKRIKKIALTLHVGAGTFKPVTAATIADHTMHSEVLILSPTVVQLLLNKLNTIVAVGTTSLRTLESIYWLALFWRQSGCEFPPELPQWFPYQETSLPSNTEIFEWLLEKLNGRTLQVKTQLLIVPGYKFRVCDGLITNFHQPCSTLILLVAAFVGENWREIYNHALENNYRFLSYGDSSLLWRKDLKHD